jgi:transcriptional regulator with XRE-family HTH domain
MRATFGKTLQRLREAAGMSQVELARRSDTPIDSLRNWEQGRVLPRIDAAKRLARALGVSLDQLAAEGEAPAGDQPPANPAPQGQPAAHRAAGDQPPPQRKPARRKLPRPRGG